jgi:DNA-binding response OmpR family regulator
VLLDIGLPDTDGVEVARTLRQEQERKPVRIVAVTGRSSVEDRRRALQAGFDQYLVKPIKPDELHSVLSPSARDVPPV